MNEKKQTEHVYEIVDCSDDEISYPLGIYLYENEAIKDLEHGQYYQAHYPEIRVILEVRKRKIGYTLDNYEVVYKAEWREKLDKNDEWKMIRIN